MDIIQRDDLPFPQSLPEFQRLFPDDAACATYLEKARWKASFVCPLCGVSGSPFRFANRPGVLRCRSCRKNTGLTVGTVMERSRTPLSVWFWAAYLVSSQAPGMSAAQFQRQIGLKRYETAFQILHKLRAGMVRPDHDPIGGRADEHVEVDETWVGGGTRGEGHSVHHKSLVVAAAEVRQRKPGTKLDARRNGRYAGRIRLAVIPDRSVESLCGFVEHAVARGTKIITDNWSGYANIDALGYDRHAVAERGDPRVAEEHLPIVHLVFANLKTWLIGTHHGVSPQHLQAYLNEFTFRFNRRFYPFNAFRSLLAIAGEAAAPTYDALYSGKWRHPTCRGNVNTVGKHRSSQLAVRRGRWSAITSMSADTDAILKFPCVPGKTHIDSPGVKLTDLSAGPINHHWTQEPGGETLMDQSSMSAWGRTATHRGAREPYRGRSRDRPEAYLRLRPA